MQVDQTKENKTRMQEELIRIASSKIADREASAERARRIKEDQVRNEEVERQETIELLLNVQKQLLDTCGHLQVGNIKRENELLSCSWADHHSRRTKLRWLNVELWSVWYHHQDSWVDIERILK